MEARRLGPPSLMGPPSQPVWASPRRSGSATWWGEFGPAFIGCAILVGWFVFAFPICRHWFVLPVSLCGVLVARDVILWLRGRIDLFDPLGILALLFLKGGFLGPFLKLILGHWLVHPHYPDDWRPWLGYMAILDLLGYWVYRRVVFAGGRAGRARPGGQWRLVSSQFYPALAAALLLSGVVTVLVYRHFGGLAGYMAAFEERQGFEGLGVVLTLGEAFPILAFIGIAHALRSRRKAVSWPLLFVLVAGHFTLQMLCGGLRGSRSNTIYAMFWAVGMVHHYLRPLTRKVILLGIAVMIPFLYIYGFYKHFGREGFLKAIQSAEARQELNQSRTYVEGPWYGRFLGGGTQVFTLYRIMRPESDYQYAWGRTYLAALTRFVPRQIWPDRPEGKRKYGTDALYGAGTYPQFRSSLVWGLSGEAMLNFGPLAVPLFYVFPGLLVRWLRARRSTWPPGDARWLLYPFGVLFCVQVVGSDAELLPFYFVKNGLLPFLVVWIGCRRQLSGGESRGSVGGNHAYPPEVIHETAYRHGPSVPAARWRRV